MIWAARAQELVGCGFFLAARATPDARTEGRKSLQEGCMMIFTDAQAHAQAFIRHQLYINICVHIYECMYVCMSVCLSVCMYRVYARTQTDSPVDMYVSLYTR